MTKIAAIFVHHDGIRQHHINLWMGIKIVAHCVERAWQVLLITIQISNDVSLGAFPTAIHGIVHALVFFDESLDPCILREPILRAVIRAGILHDVLKLHARLVGHGSDAQLEPR